MGRVERRAVASQLGNAPLRVLKVHGWPDHTATDHRLAEATAALLNTRKAIDPGMRQRLDPDEAHRDARSSAEGLRMGGRGPRPMPAAIPMSFDELRSPGLTAFEPLGRAQTARAAEEGGATP